MGAVCFVNFWVSYFELPDVLYDIQVASYELCARVWGEGLLAWAGSFIWCQLLYDSHSII